MKKRRRKEGERNCSRRELLVDGHRGPKVKKGLANWELSTFGCAKGLWIFSWPTVANVRGFARGETKEEEETALCSSVVLFFILFLALFQLPSLDKGERGDRKERGRRVAGGD
jgi:hypothetical protein